ncbi:vWA domain-containing protein [Mycolicibacterium pulveris]|uniref:vWA domain-containing protein n=1 Tax=Mycolicibacterium pulveris TaxID=36813 RepID=UPI003CF4365E
MTFAPVVPAAILLVVAAAVIVLRLITMRSLASGPRLRWSTVWRWSGLTLALLLMLIAAARPGFGHHTPQHTTAAQSGENTSVFFLVDRTTDAGDAIRDDIQTLIEQHPQSRFAVISFAARPSLDWPLSQDAWSLVPEIAALTRYDGPRDQVNAAAAANVLRYQLIAADQQYPGSQNLVYYFGAGAPGSRAPQGDFDPVAGSVDGGAVFGYGATLNEPGLRRIAEQLGVPYLRPGELPAPQTAPDGAAARPDADAGRRTELYWVFTIVAAVLLLFESYSSIRELHRTRTARREVPS